jgi:hypothetical protein
MWYKAPTDSSPKATATILGGVYPQLVIQTLACGMRYPINTLVRYWHTILVTETHQRARGC